MDGKTSTDVWAYERLERVVRECQVRAASTVDDVHWLVEEGALGGLSDRTAFVSPRLWRPRGLGTGHQE